MALVEVAGSITLGIEPYLLSSMVGDWIEEKEGRDTSRKCIAMELAAGVVGYFLLQSLRPSLALMSGLTQDWEQSLREQTQDR